MVDTVDDLLSAPRVRDDRTLSTEGVEELFALAADDVLEDSLTLDAVVKPPNPVETESSAADDSIHDLLSSLIDEMKNLAGDFHKQITP